MFGAPHELTATQVFRRTEPSAISLIKSLLEYTPTRRLSAVDAMAHEFFDDLRKDGVTLPPYRDSEARRPLPPKLFDFDRHGMWSEAATSLQALTPL